MYSNRVNAALSNTVDTFGHPGPKLPRADIVSCQRVRRILCPLRLWWASCVSKFLLSLTCMCANVRMHSALCHHRFQQLASGPNAGCFASTAGADTFFLAWWNI